MRALPSAKVPDVAAFPADIPHRRIISRRGVEFPTVVEPEISPAHL